MTKTAYQRRARLDSWPGPGVWGYDAVLEAYWARLRPRSGSDAAVEIGADHLIATLPGLARALAEAIGAEDVEVYLALTSPWRGGSPEADAANLT